jgi:hypothetical protein
MKLTINLDDTGYDEDMSVTDSINRVVEAEVVRHILAEVRSSLAKRKEEIKKQIGQATEAELIRAMQLLKAEKASKAEKAAHEAAVQALNARAADRIAHCEICGGKGCPHCKGTQ